MAIIDEKTFRIIYRNGAESELVRNLRRIIICALGNSIRESSTDDLVYQTNFHSFEKTQIPGVIGAIQDIDQRVSCFLTRQAAPNL